MRRSALIRIGRLFAPMIRNGLLAASLLAFVGQAQAQRVPSQEAGAVRLIFEPWSAPPPARVVQPEGVAWEETLIIPDAVRLDDDVPARGRPNAEAVPAGTILYGYALRGGVAYCVPFDTSGVHVRGVQCFRDFNDDGVFDGAYVSRSLVRTMRAFPTYLHALVSQQGEINYSRVEDLNLAPRLPGHVIFVGMEEGLPRLRMDTLGQIGAAERSCVRVEENVCSWNAVLFRFEQRGGSSVEIEPIESSPNRRFVIYMADAR